MSYTAPGNNDIQFSWQDKSSYVAPDSNNIQFDFSDTGGGTGTEKIISVWDGTQWLTGTLLYFSGTTWNAGILKQWNGTQWV